ncbi:MAG: hypothetical protein R3282_07670, partial [Rhodothermales bacterium]|nr:hypothetical protein [Rhodothermales bacterium]
NTQFLTRARLDGSLSDGRLTGIFDAETPQGRAAAAATGRPFDEIPAYQLTDGVFENIDLGAIAGRERLRTALNGRFELDLIGVELDRLVADGRFELAGSRFNDEVIESGRLTISADSGRYASQAFLEAGGGSLEFEGAADLNDEEPFEVRATLQNLNVAGLLGADTLASHVTASFSASGAGLQKHRTTGQGRLRLAASRYQDIEIEALSANLSIDGKLLRLDTLTARSNVVTASGSGIVALASDPDLPASNLEVQAEIVDLKPLHSILPPAERLLAKGRISVSVSGEPDDVRFRADGMLTNIAYDNLRVGAIDARVVGSLDENRTVASAESRIEISQLSLPTLAARTTTIEAAYLEDQIRYEANSSLDARRDIRTSGVVDLSANIVELTMTTLRVRLDNDRWQLLQPSSITFADEYRIRNFLLYSETQQIAVDGYIDLDGEQSLIMTIEQFRMGGVADLFDYGGVDGTLNGYIDLSGPAAAPIVTGSLTADLVSLKRPVGDLSLDLAYSDLRLNIEGRLRNEEGSALTLSGHLPLDLRLASRGDDQGVAVRTAAAGGESRLTVRSDGFAIDWILPFLDPELFNSIGGTLTGQVDITGTFSDPELTGEATLTKGSVGLT